MDNNIPEIDELIKQFSKLPGLGPKSAKRIILKLINNKENMVKPLAKSLANVYKTIIWGYISIPYDSANTINGEYSFNKINPLNDTFRGLIFIFVPIVFYCFTFSLGKRNKRNK